MAVAVRLSRIGKKHVPFFRVVAVDSRKKRDGAFLEDLGTYDALKGVFVTFREERYDAWVAQGATISDAVKRLKKKHKKSLEVAPQAAIKKPSAKAASVVVDDAGAEASQES